MPKTDASKIVVLLSLFVLPATFPMVASGQESEPLTLYVSQEHGNDDWSGRQKSPEQDGKDGPFATIRKAKSTIRKLKKENGGLSRPVTVNVRDGRYVLRKPLVFSPADSGTSSHRITYRAYPGESPVISGGRRLGDWRKTDGDLWKMKLKRVASGNWSFRQLWVNGKRRPRARIPNDGSFHFKKMVKPDEPGAEINRRAFVFKDGQIKADWTNLKDVEILKYFGWNEARRTIQKVDTENNVCYLAGPMAKSERRPMNWFGKRFVVENVREGLDRPGEWYLNESTGVLWYYPTESERSSGSADAVAPVVDRLVAFDGTPGKKRVKHVTLSGFTFKHSGAAFPDTGYNERQSDPFVPGAFHGQGTRDVRISRNEIVHVGTYGMDFPVDNRGLSIVGNHLHDLGAGGIQIGKTREPANRSRRTKTNRITDNEIHHGGQIYIAGAGIWIGHSAYNTVAHNEIHHMLNNAISVGWHWKPELTSCHHNTITYNHIHDIGLGVIGGASGVYFLSRQPGTEMHHNLIHDLSRYTGGKEDIDGHGPSHASFGIQVDPSAQIHYHHNVIYNVPDAAYKQMGREHVVYNNIFGYASLGPEIIRRRAGKGTVFFSQNIVLSRDSEVIGGHWDRKNAEVDYNLYYTFDNKPEFDGKSLGEWRETGRDQNSIVARPELDHIEDPAKGDLFFDPGKPGEKIGFEPIDLRSVGPRKPPRQP